MPIKFQKPTIFQLENIGHKICRPALGLAIPIGFLLIGCEKSPEQQGPRYGVAETSDTPTFRFDIHPLHNPRKLTETYQPLIDYLDKNIPNTHFRLEASRDYQAFEAKFRAREPEFILPNPWQTLEAMKTGYRVIAMSGDPEDFKGIFIVRKDSSIRTPADLKGKAVSYPSPTALAACIMPQRFLHDSGVNILRDVDNRYVGSQESSIMNAYLKQTAAAATWPPPWRTFQKDHPDEAAQMKVIWETKPLLNNSVMVRDDVPAALSDRVTQLLAGLSKTAEGKNILAGIETERFHTATNDTYTPVRDFIARFEKDVRPVESKKP